MAILMVTFDPSDRILVKPEHLPKGSAHVTMMIRDEPMADDRVERLTATLAQLLINQIALAKKTDAEN